MKQEIAQGLATSAVTLTTSTGILTSVLAYLGSNAAGIGAASTLFFGFVYIYFQWASNKKLTIADSNAIEIEHLSEKVEENAEMLDIHRAETKVQIQEVSDGIQDIKSILTKLG